MTQKNKIVNTLTLTTALTTLWVGLLLSAGCQSASAGSPQRRALIMDRFFSIMDVNGDLAVTPEEFTAARGRQFSKMDADLNGMISLPEWEKNSKKRRKWLDTKGKTPAVTPQEQFALLDADGNAFISTDEFLRSSDPIFTRMDKNRDGVILKNEFLSGQPAGTFF